MLGTQDLRPAIRLFSKADLPATAENAAQRLYRKVLGAETEATIASLCSADEVLVVARAPLAAASRR